MQQKAKKKGVINIMKVPIVHSNLVANGELSNIVGAQPSSPPGSAILAEASQRLARVAFFVLFGRILKMGPQALGQFLGALSLSLTSLLILEYL